MSLEAAATAGHHGAPGHGHGGGPSVPDGVLGHHFSSIERQNEAMRLGMWLFLATEVLLFAGLFCGYTVYRFQFPLAFKECSRHLEIGLGTLNTVVLITSSFTVALSIHYARCDKPKLAAFCLFLTLLFALGFMGIKAAEYRAHFAAHEYPGKFYAGEVHIAGAAMFYTLYFLMTGLHGIHVVVGGTVLFILMIRTWRGRYSSAYYTGLEMGGLYWHLVDLVWIFLYPLLYLI
jgi:cytochrome c oxidase subunit 3